MSELPQIPREELYKSLYEKLQKENSELTENVATLEILATKLRDQRDEARSDVAHRDGLLKSLREENKDVVPEVIDGDLVE